MMCSLLNEDEDKDNQVLMVFQYHPIMDTEGESVHCKSYRAAQMIELQKTLNYGLIYVHTHMIMLT